MCAQHGGGRVHQRLQPARQRAGRHREGARRAGQGCVQRCICFLHDASRCGRLLASSITACAASMPSVTVWTICTTENQRTHLCAAAFTLPRNARRLVPAKGQDEPVHRVSEQTLSLPMTLVATLALSLIPTSIVRSCRTCGAATGAARAAGHLHGPRPHKGPRAAGAVI